MLVRPITISEICSPNVHDLDLDRWNYQRSNISMPIERPHSTLFDGNSNVCLIFYHLRDSRMGRSEMQICHSKAHI